MTLDELVVTFGGSYVCANFGENPSRNATVRVLADGHTDRRKPILLANVNSRSRSLYVIVRTSVVCLSSVTFVHPTQAIENFGHVSTPCGTLAIHDLLKIFLQRSSQGTPSLGLNPRGVAKYRDFGPFEGYISETMQDMI